MPRVSVIIPARDAERTLGQALASLEEQNFGDWEAIVVDDGSSDATAEVAQSFGPRVRVVQSDGGLGCGGARNLAAKTASGQELAFLDADDIWMPDFLAQTLDALDASRRTGRPAGIVAADARILTPSGPAPYTCRDLFGPRWASVTLDHLVHHNRLFLSTVVPRDVFDEVGGFWPVPAGAAEDLDLWIRIAERGYPIERLPVVLALYRRTPGAMSSDLASMASSVCEVLRRSLARGRLTPRQQRIARRSLRHYRRLERLARARDMERTAPLAQIAARVLIVTRNPRLLHTLRARKKASGPLADEDSADRPTTVLLALPSLGIGGAERVVVTLAHGLKARNVKVLVAAAQGPLAEELPPGTEFIVLRPGNGPVAAVANVARLRRVIAAHQVDVINSHHAGIGLVTRAAAMLSRRRIRHVLTVHVPERKAGEILVALGATAFDRVICVSDGVRRDLARWLPAGVRARLTTVNPGVAEARPGSGDQLRIAVVARLVRRKGHREMLAAWRSLDVPNRFPGWMLELWGDGPERLDLQQEIEAGLASTVALRGAVADAAQHMGDLSILVLPSLREGLPLVLLEAAAAGVPVVATDLPGCRDAVGDAAGVLVKAGDVAALAAALENLMGDVSRRKRLGEAGRARWVQHFQMEHFLTRYLPELSPGHEFTDPGSSAPQAAQEGVQQGPDVTMGGTRAGAPE